MVSYECAPRPRGLLTSDLDSNKTDYSRAELNRHVCRGTDTLTEVA